FMSFWTGDRMMEVWRYMGPGVNQAHSGYIEQYLNLGYVGVAFIALLSARALWRIRTQSLTAPEVAALRLSFILAALLYNYSEASFYGINNMWVLTLMAWMQVPESQAHRVGLGVGSNMFHQGMLPVAPKSSPPAQPLARDAN